jgi:hypothetical protein
MPTIITRGAGSARGFGFAGLKPVPIIGSALGGGYFAGQISTSGNGTADYNLVVAPKSSGQAASITYGDFINYPNTSSDIDGPTNSANLNSPNNPAAEFCEGLTIGGFSDWYMPAKNELEVCYYNLKPSFGGNDPNSGINPNAVPARSSNYGALPGQTTATDFQKGGAQAFDLTRYWSSTQAGSISANWQEFNSEGNGGGFQSTSTKSNSYYVRAVRRIPV